MHAKARLLRLGCGLTLLALSGCYSPRPYGYYGGGYPGMYAPGPAGTVPQGPTMLPPQTFTPGGGTDAPLYNPGSSGFNNSSGSNPVPEYRDPSSYDGGADDLKLNNEDPESPFSYHQPDSPAGGTASVAALTAVDAEGTFLQPVSATAPAVQTNAGASQQPAGNRNPFDHDRENYRWLRGVVDYDAADGTWNIIYDATPDANDQFGGSITLIADERFSVLRDNDVVLVQGYVDQQVRDRFDKPSYRVEELAQLFPK